MKCKFFGILFLMCVLALSSCDDDNNDNGTEPVVDYSSLVLNEICGLQNPDDDWIELFNKSGDKSIIIDGVKIVKTDETGASSTIYTIPENTVLAAGEYMVIATLSSELTAGISNSKQVGIALYTSDDEEIDAFDRDDDILTGFGHASGGSYARIPDGTGSWKVVKGATRGESNVAETASSMNYSGLALNEICGKQNPDNDWVELYNGSGSAMDISGVRIIKTGDDNISETIYIVPESTNLAAGAYLQITRNEDGISAGISNDKQVGIAIASPNAVIIDQFDRDEDIGVGQEHYAGGSYARLPDGTGDWIILLVATPGAENVETEPSGNNPNTDYEQIVINELNGNNNTDPLYVKFIELYNNSDNTYDISGIILKRNGGETIYIAPEGTEIAGKGFLVLLANQSDYSTGFSSGLSAKQSLKVELYKPDGETLIDIFKNQDATAGDEWATDNPKYDGTTYIQSFGRYPDGEDNWFMMTPTQGTANTEGDEAITWTE